MSQWKDKPCEHKKCMWGYLDKVDQGYVSYKQEAFFCVDCGLVFKTKNTSRAGVTEDGIIAQKKYMQQIELEYGGGINS